MACFVLCYQSSLVGLRLLPSTRQHPSYGDCLEVKREYYQNSSVLDCVTHCSQSAADLCEQFLQVNRLGLSHWDPYAVRRGGCLELYYCNMVEWFWWDSTMIPRTNWLRSVANLPNRPTLTASAHHQLGNRAAHK